MGHAGKSMKNAFYVQWYGKGTVWGEVTSNSKKSSLLLGMRRLCFFFLLFFFPAILSESTYYAQYFAQNP